MYTLILTFVFIINGKAAVSTTSVPEFSSQASCLKAGNDWLKQNDRNAGASKALCVYTPGG